MVFAYYQVIYECVVRLLVNLMRRMLLKCLSYVCVFRVVKAENWVGCFAVKSNAPVLRKEKIYLINSARRKMDGNNGGNIE